MAIVSIVTGGLHMCLPDNLHNLGISKISSGGREEGRELEASQTKSHGRLDWEGAPERFDSW